MKETLYGDKLDADIIESILLLQFKVEEINRANGWYDNSVRMGEAIALIHSEVSELLEWVRSGVKKESDHVLGRTGVQEELADIIIRVLDFASKYNIVVAPVILEKLIFNRSRGYKHGGKKL